MPDFRGEIKARLGKLNLPPTREAEIVEELGQHLEEQYEDMLNRGAGEDAARLALLEDLQLPRALGQAFNYVEPIPIGLERKRNILAGIGQDVRYGLRVLGNNPAFTAIDRKSTRLN